ncbi:bleomycin resistance protein [Paenibacillus sp. NPDC056579]|uniref:bleomycin resistance protein n=1 Tax=unclassified Paenibacillus TaxID=185978 RepID=UPI001EF8494B|nr:bleomycin resistance protein [Paenibacillus sp. H1-7]ULL18091.1 bleomycin resistance protein [Paenibacillus sp. H1-7]
MVPIQISGTAVVLLVKNLEQSIQFYTCLGFAYEAIGGNIKHHHVSRDKLTLILLQARHEDDVKPLSSMYEEQYFDVFCYTNAVDLLFSELAGSHVTIARAPHYSLQWSEFTIQDCNGYSIAFGGGIVNPELALEELRS